MRRNTLTLIGILTTLLWAAAGYAAPVMVPAKGGLPACQAVLSAPPLCGNGVIDTGEQCDQGNLNGQTCASLGFLVGTLQCGANCQFDISGCTNTRFVDNGDGTVTDQKTGLMWEKKDQSGGIHDWTNKYSWSTSASAEAPGGTVFMVFLATLDKGLSPDGESITGCFANHCDWRLPSIVELQGIVDLSEPGCGKGTGACIDPIFGPTQIDLPYWSSTSLADSPGLDWSLAFAWGGAPLVNKTVSFYVRAVRSGL